MEAYKSARNNERQTSCSSYLDIGGDKELPLFKSTQRNEPILRLQSNSSMLDQQDIFRNNTRIYARQLR